MARVVMLVDNTVDGDSRVQKVAASVAAAGYDSTLIGRSPTANRDEYALGDARVVRLPQPYVLHATVKRAPGRSLRWPLAYPSREVAAWRKLRLAALERQQLDRRMRLRSLRRGGAVVGAVPTWAALRLWRLLIAVMTLWHKVRNHELMRAIRSRSARNGWLDDVVAVLWRRVRGLSCWRRLEPLLLDYELVYGPEIDRLRPDLIHAHDYRTIGIAVRAARRARAAGRQCTVVYDAHEFMPGVRPISRRWKIANEAHELQYAGQADAVVTVSPRLAEMLRERHSLGELPTVVLNAPAVPSLRRDGSQLRRDLGLAASVPLMVYSGGVGEQRGLHTVVSALPQLLEVHLAIVTTMPNATVDSLLHAAERLGVVDRVHVQPYVAQELVTSYLKSADVGLIPLLHHVNHEIALITKYFEYAQAGLPIVVSDVEAMAAATRELGNGEVFTAGDVDGLAAAVRKVLADPQAYRDAYVGSDVVASWTWPEQARVLVELYSRLVGRV